MKTNKADFSEGKIQKILVRAPNWLGDAIMALPTIAALREAYPRAHLTVATKPNLRAVFCGIADNFLPTQRGVAGVKNALAMRQEKFDFGLLLTNSFSSAAWMASAGAKYRIGYSRDARGWMLTHPVACSRDLLTVHQSVYYANLLRTLGMSGEISSPRLRVDDAGVNECAKFLVENKLAGQAYVTMAPCSAFGAVKDWSLDNYLEVAKQIKKRLRLTTILTGTAAQADALSSIADGSTVLNSAGKLSLEGLFAFLRGARVFIGGDSGAAHAAAALGVPTVVIFGITDPTCTRPLGDEEKIRVLNTARESGVKKMKLNSRSGAKAARAALEAITVEKVVSAVSAIAGR